jgi:hypothetical protein
MDGSAPVAGEWQAKTRIMKSPFSLAFVTSALLLALYVFPSASALHQNMEGKVGISREPYHLYSDQQIDLLPRDLW